MRGILCIGILLTATTAVVVEDARAETKPIAYSWPIKKVSSDLPSDVVLHNLIFEIPFLATDILPSEAFSPSVHIQTAGVTGEQVIREFIHQDPRYTSVIEGDWVVVMPTQAAANSEYPLNLVVDRVAVKDANLGELAVAILDRLKRTTGREIFFRHQRDVFGLVDVEHISLDMSSRTVRSILLEGAIQQGRSIEFSITHEKGDTVINSLPWLLPMHWDSVRPRAGPFEPPGEVQVPPSVIEVLKRRHREGLATPAWRP